MENDTIRGSGGNTFVDLWVEGKMRAIIITRGAIEAHLGLLSDRTAAMTEADRCEFVRGNLALVHKVAKAKLRDVGPDAETIVLESGELGLATGGRSGQRRKGDRRKSDRPEAIPPAGDRRRAQRRTGDRRAREADPKQD